MCKARAFIVQVAMQSQASVQEVTATGNDYWGFVLDTELTMYFKEAS